MCDYHDECGTATSARAEWKAHQLRRSSRCNRMQAVASVILHDACGTARAEWKANQRSSSMLTYRMPASEGPFCHVLDPHRTHHQFCSFQQIRGALPSCSKGHYCSLVQGQRQWQQGSCQNSRKHHTNSHLSAILMTFCAPYYSIVFKNLLNIDLFLRSHPVHANLQAYLPTHCLTI